MQLSFKLMLKPENGKQADREKCAAFAQRFSTNVGKYPHVFNFSTNEIESVRAFIRAHKTPSLLFYRILPDNNQLDEFQAYQIPLIGIDDLFSNKEVTLNKLRKAGIAKDYSSETIVASKEFVNTMQVLCKGLKWEALNEDCFNLVGIQKLQEPIQVINALEIRENAKPPSTFTITGDGRKVIPNNALAKVYANGLIINDLSEANGEVFMTPNIFIVSTPIMQQLLEAKFKHISKHILPLLNADQVAELS